METPARIEGANGTQEDRRTMDNAMKETEMNHGEEQMRKTEGEGAAEVAGSGEQQQQLLQQQPRPKSEGGMEPGLPTNTATSRAEIYTYEAPWPVYSISWSVREDRRFRLACGSFLEEYSNAVQIIHLAEDDDQAANGGGGDEKTKGRGTEGGAEAPSGEGGKDDAMMDADYAKREEAATGRLRFHADPRFSFPHPYPTTKIMFMPSSDTSKQDMIATCGDYLRIWPINEEGVNVNEAILLSNVRVAYSNTHTHTHTQP